MTVNSSIKQDNEKKKTTMYFFEFSKKVQQELKRRIKKT